MGIYEPDGLVFQASSITPIWQALIDHAEQNFPLSGGHEPWCEFATVGGVSRSLLVLYVELLTRCAKVLVRTDGPAFLIRTVKSKTKPYSLVDVYQSGLVLLKTAQVVLAFRKYQPKHFEKVHPLVTSLTLMFDEKNLSDDLVYPMAPMTDRSLHDLCDELLFLYGVAFFRESGSPLADVDDKDRIDRINSLIVAFQCKVRRQSAQIRLWERSTERRRQKVMGELLPLVDNGMTQLYVVGMDFWLGSGEPSADQKQLRNYFLQLMNNLRFKPKVSKRLHRVIWRLPVDVGAASRYHCLFIMDGSLVGSGPQFVELIGAYWNAEITAGQGQWFDWAHHTSDSCRSTVGCIDLSDKQKISVFMDRVLSYFADFDLYAEPSVRAQSSAGGEGRIAKLRIIGSRRFSST